MGRDVIDNLGTAAGGILPPSIPPADDGPEDILLPPRPAVDKAGGALYKGIPFDGVPGQVAENAHIGVEQGQRVFQHRARARLHGGLPRPPGFAVHQLFAGAEGGVQLSANSVHQLHRQQAHEVEAEAVDVVFPGPVQHGIDNVIVHHGPACGDIVSAGGAVGQRAVLVPAVIISRGAALQPGVGAVGVVIHHVHHHPQPVLVEGLNHLPALPDAGRAVGRVGGIAALRHIVVHRVIAPVELLLTAPLVHRAEVKHGQQLDVGHPQARQVLHTRRQPAVLIPPGERLEFPPVLGGHPAVRVKGEILHVQLVDDLLRLGGGRSVAVPALRAGAGQIHRHAAPAVAAAGHGIGVGGGPAHAVCPNGVVIVCPVEVFIHRRLPDAPVPPRQRQDLIRLGNAVPVQGQLHPLGLGAPQLEDGAPLCAQAAQIPAVIAVQRVKAPVICCLFHRFHSLPPFISLPAHRKRARPAPLHG